MFKCIPTRIVLAFLCATGVMELYMSRTNLSITIVKMVRIVNSESASNEPPREPYCLINNTIQSFSIQNTTDLNNTVHKVNDYQNITEESLPVGVTTTQRGNILSAFFYAYGLSAILGGRLAEKFGTKKIFAGAVFVDALGNFLVPVAAKSSYIFLMAIRFTMGLFQGMCYPAMHALLPKWVPKDELSRFIGAVYIANSFGTIFTFQFCGIIVNDYGHEYAFYLCGLLGLIWLFFWVLLMHETPEVHPRILNKEKIYILENRNYNKSAKKKRTPWLKILISLRVWALNVAHAAGSFGLVFIITQLPLYMNSIIGVNIKTNGFLSSLPLLSRYLGGTIISWVVNFLMIKTNWSKSTWQRICTVMGHWGTGLCILLVGYVGCNPTAALCLLSLATFLNGATCSGALCNHLQIAPNYAGTLFGVSNTVGYYFTSFGPLIVGALTPEETLGEWINVYWVIFSTYFVCGSFYMLFLSTEIQPWNDDHDTSKSNDTDDPEQENLKAEIKA